MLLVQCTNPHRWSTFKASSAVFWELCLPISFLPGRYSMCSYAEPYNFFSFLLPSSEVNLSMETLLVIGAIPDGFGTNQNLQTFDVRNNALTALPSAWTDPNFVPQRSSLSYVWFLFNNLTVSFVPVRLGMNTWIYLDRLSHRNHWLEWVLPSTS